MARPDHICEKYGAGSVVALDLVCPRATCRREAKGTAVVVNDFGVRDVVPRLCGCGVTYRVKRVVDVEALDAE